MPRIDWPDGAARIFVVTEITYVADVRTGSWRTQLAGEQWTAGPETWGSGAPLSGGHVAVAFTAGPPEMQQLPVLPQQLPVLPPTGTPAGYRIVVDPNTTVDSEPPSVVSRIEWWWGDAAAPAQPADAVVEPPPGEAWVVGGLPLGEHGYTDPGAYTIRLRLTLDGNPSGQVSQTVTVG